MRKKGASINLIAAFIGRSTSFVARILKSAKRTSPFSFSADLRKLPNRIKRLSAKRQLQTMEKLRRAWELFIRGQGERPP